MWVSLSQGSLVVDVEVEPNNVVREWPHIDSIRDIALNHDTVAGRSQGPTHRTQPQFGNDGVDDSRISHNPQNIGFKF